MLNYTVVKEVSDVNYDLRFAARKTQTVRCRDLDKTNVITNYDTSTFIFKLISAVAMLIVLYLSDSDYLLLYACSFF